MVKIFKFAKGLAIYAFSVAKIMVMPISKFMKIPIRNVFQIVLIIGLLIKILYLAKNVIW